MQENEYLKRLADDPKISPDLYHLLAGIVNEIDALKTRFKRLAFEVAKLDKPRPPPNRI